MQAAPLLRAPAEHPLTIEMLRRLLATPAPAGTPSNAGANAPAPATGSAAEFPPPLATADRRGLAPGVTPTPDRGGPTAFPYPYPYAPPPR